jgi:hypothetical protein
VPLVPRVPDQLPDAVQAVALVLDQVSVLVLPLATVAGLAEIITVAAGGAALLLLPPPPLQPDASITSNSAAAVRNEFQQCCCICCCFYLRAWLRTEVRMLTRRTE